MPVQSYSGTRVAFWTVTIRDAFCPCVQKLGIPTEIGTAWIGYYDTPVEDLSHGESINIMPGIRKTDYRETGAIRARAQHGLRSYVAGWRQFALCVFCRGGVEQVCVWNQDGGLYRFD